VRTHLRMPTSFPIKYTRVRLIDAVPCKALFCSTFASEEWSKWHKVWKHRNTLGCWVARYHGVVIGVCLVSKSNVIKYIAVDPDYQGYKIGSTLLNLILTDLKDVRSVRLTTASDMRLMTWYGRFGFRIQETIYNDDGEFLGAHMVRYSRSKVSIATIV
jgi:ribosomal protein S18 acetylase RimI-like enzyme